MERKDSRGVTLLELLVTLAVIGLMAVAAWPRLTAMGAGLELRAGVMRLASAFLRARTAALARGRAWEVRVLDDRTFAVGAVGEAAVRTELPPGVRFVRSTAGGVVRFSPSGRAGNATLVLAASGLRRSVVVNQRGRVSVRAGTPS
jgi:prepilin-type N-terminal cleavage/methylation domain-containing protein